jgi:hypothetical protein
VSTRFKGDEIVASGADRRGRGSSEDSLGEGLPHTPRRHLRGVPEIEPGEIQITVAAASNKDLSVAGANLTCFTL